jgi:hypothetical protein
VKVEQAAQDAAAAARTLEARLETAGQPAAVFVEGGLAADDEGAAVAEASPPQPSRSRRGRAKASGGTAAPAAKPARQRKGRQAAKDRAGEAATAASAEAAAGVDAPVRPGTKGIGAVATAKVYKSCGRPPACCNALLACRMCRTCADAKVLPCCTVVPLAICCDCRCSISASATHGEIRPSWCVVLIPCGGALNVQEAALEKKRAGENRAVEHVALDDDPSDGIAAAAKPAKRARRKQQA